MRSLLSHIECSGCSSSFEADALHNLCPRCAAPLLCRYELGGGIDWPRSLETRPPAMWRYWELLPLQSQDGPVSLGEVMTPLIALPRLGAELRLPRLVVKDEGLLPAGSFKARGAAVGVARLRELGGRALIMPSNGNAGAAWALYAARAGLAAHVVMPEDAPLIARQEAQLAGAVVTVVPGTISDAGARAREIADAGGLFDAGTFKEPYRLEGKKTMGFEIAEQYEWRLPDVIVYPTGGGVGLIGMWKAWQELRLLGLVDGLPRLVAAQASGCAPVVRAWESGADQCEPWVDAMTDAFGINVPHPLAGRLILSVLRESNGCAVAVDDAATARERATAARTEGVHLCPEGACALAAVRALASSGWLRDAQSVLVLNTGSGLKYPVNWAEG